MMIVYGSMLCPDCVQIREDFARREVQYEYRDIGENLLYLKEFLAIRDGNALFDPVREKGSIGIPCIVREDGSVTLSWAEFM